MGEKNGRRMGHCKDRRRCRGMEERSTEGGGKNGEGEMERGGRKAGKARDVEGNGRGAVWGTKWWIKERPDGWRSMVKMRMEDGLMIEKGRYRPKIPREKRVCAMCGEKVEDAWHLMGECEWVEVERKEFWNDVRWKLNVWWNVEMVQKGKLGVSTLGGRSLVARMEEMDGWEKVKTWLG